MSHWRIRLIQVAALVSLGIALPSPAASMTFQCSNGQALSCSTSCQMNGINCTHDGGQILLDCGGGCFLDGQGSPVCDDGVVCFYPY